MVRASSRDVSLTLSIETLGEEGIRKLEDSVRALALEGGNAGPEFAQLADELSRIGEQRDALQAFRAIADETTRLEQRQTEAATAVQQLTDRLESQRGAVAQAQAAQAEAAANVRRLKDALADATTAVQQNRTGYDAAGNAIDNYKAKTAGLIADQARINKELREARTAQTEANAAVTSAVAEQSKLETSLARVQRSAAAATTAVTANKTALAESAAAAEQLGVSTDNVAQAEARLLQSFNDVGAAAARVSRETSEYAAVQQRLAGALASQQVEADAAAAAFQRQQQFINDAEDAIREYERAIEAAADAEAQRVVESARSEAAWQSEAEAIVNAVQAVDRLSEANRRAAEQALELRNVRAFEEQARQAQELVRATDYVNFWTQALNRAEAETRQFQGALDTLNVRSVEQIRNEIEQTRQAMALLATRSEQTGESFAGAFTVGQARVRELEREVREVTGALTAADRAADLFKNSIGQITAGNLVADGIGALVERVKDLGREFVISIVEIEKLRRGLNAVYGDSRLVTQQIEFLRQAALGSGVSVSVLQENFVRFAASLNGANIPLEQTNALFLAVTRAAGTLGLSSEQVGGTLNALSQIASKGVVSLEELGQQLGDRLPAVLSSTAKAFGITEGELRKLVESGNLAARDFIPAFTQALRGLEGEATGLQVSFNNLKTSLTVLAQEGGDAGWTQILLGGIKLLTAGVGILGGALLGITNVLSVIGAAVISTVASITTLSNQFGFLSEQVDAAAARQAKFSDTIDAALGGLEKEAVAAQSAATAQQALASQTSQATAAVALQNVQVGQTTQGMAALKIAQDAAALSTGAQTANIVKLNTEFTKLLVGLEAEQLALDKQAKATEVSGRAIEQLTKLRGNEAVALATAVSVADNNVAALQRVAQARQAEVEVLAVQLQAVTADLTQRGLTPEVIARETDALNTKITAASAEAEQSKAAVEQATAEAFARQLLAKAYEDNSARVAEFQTALELSREALVQTDEAVRAGTASMEELRVAAQSVTEAEALLRDAYKDRAEALKASSDAAKVEIDIRRAGLDVRKAEIDRQIESARASGDVRRATELEIESKRVQIQILRLTAEAKALEIRATREQILAERDALILSGQYEGAKRTEIETRLRAIEVKELENKLTGIAIKGLEDEIRAIREGNQARSESTGTLDTNTGARERNTEAIRRGTEASREATRSAREEIEAGREAAGTWEKLAAARAESVARTGNTTRPFGAPTAQRNATGQINIPEGYFFDAEGYNAAVTNNRTRGLVTVNPAQFIYRPAGVSSQPFGGVQQVPFGGTVPRPTPAPRPSNTATPSSAGGTTIRYEVALPSGASLTANSRAQADQFVNELERQFAQFGGSPL
jgi:tape measure domain-containing protein